MKRDTYKTLLGLHGNTVRDRAINNIKDDIIKNSINSPSCKRIKIDGVDYEAVIINSNEFNVKKIYIMPDDDISLGQIIEWNNGFWLVTNLDSDQEIQRKGIIQQCNLKLRFQLFDSIIYEQWCVVSDYDVESVSTAVYNGRVIKVPSGKTHILMPYNNITKQLHKDKRIITEKEFSIDNKEIGIVYKIEGFNSQKSDYGLGKIIDIGLTRDIYSPTLDNLDEMICDYISVNNNDTIMPIKCNIIGSKEIRINSTEKFSPIFLSDNNEEIKLMPIWDVRHSNSCTFENIENELYISVDDNINLIGEEITILLSDDTKKYKCEKKVSVVI